MREMLAVMAKAPRKGEVKTRLHVLLGAERATELYACMLRDTLAVATRLRDLRPHVRLALCYAPADAEEELLRLCVDIDDAFAQRGADLGERLFNCIRDARARTAESVVVIGADSPTLPVERLVTAFDALERQDCVALGPTEDGGYYLIGARRACEPLFEGIAWSTATVFAETVARARSCDLDVVELEPWYDVDEPRDLERLERDASPLSATQAFFRR